LVADVDNLPQIGVSEFRANPVASVRNGPVVVMHREKPALLATPIPAEAEASDAAKAARIATKLEVFRMLRSSGDVAEDLAELRRWHDDDETIESLIERLGL